MTGTRPLSTSARVHPPYLPYLHNASRTKTASLKWIPPLAAAAALSAGYAFTTYRDNSNSSHAQQQYQQRQKEEEERRRQRDMSAVMADAYGERGSLEELEAAVRAYEEAQARRG